MQEIDPITLTAQINNVHQTHERVLEQLTRIARIKQSMDGLKAAEAQRNEAKAFEADAVETQLKEVMQELNRLQPAFSPEEQVITQRYAHDLHANNAVLKTGVEFFKHRYATDSGQHKAVMGEGDALNDRIRDADGITSRLESASKLKDKEREDLEAEKADLHRLGDVSKKVEFLKSNTEKLDQEIDKLVEEEKAQQAEHEALLKIVDTQKQQNADIEKTQEKGKKARELQLKKEWRKENEKEEEKVAAVSKLARAQEQYVVARTNIEREIAAAVQNQEEVEKEIEAVCAEKAGLANQQTPKIKEIAERKKELEIAEAAACEAEREALDAQSSWKKHIPLVALVTAGFLFFAGRYYFNQADQNAKSLPPANSSPQAVSAPELHVFWAMASNICQATWDHMPSLSDAVVAEVAPFNPTDEDQKISDRQQRTPLHLAAAAGASEKVEDLLPLLKQEDINARDSDGKTPLHLAVHVRANHPNLTTQLLQKYIFSIQYLLQAGADPLAKDLQGYTPFLQAVRLGELETAEVFLLKTVIPVSDLKKAEEFCIKRKECGFAEKVRDYIQKHYPKNSEKIVGSVQHLGSFLTKCKSRFLDDHHQKKAPAKNKHTPSDDGSLFGYRRM